MANKKVSQLTSKPSVLVTDLFPIADPSTGQLYKTTISDLGTAIGSGVSSVNGLVGAVVLDTDDIQELVSPTNKWFTDTRARAALSASSPLAYNSGTGVFSIPAATSSQNGYLTSTDWTTFNGKQAALSGTGFVKISGTTISYDNTSYLPLTGGTLTGTLIGTRAEFTTSTLVDGILVNNGSGRGIRIVNGGAGYGLIINNETASSAIPFVIQKSGLDKIYFTDSGAGNFTSSLTASSFVKSGGTSSQYLMADGSVSTLTNPVTGTGTSGIVAKFNGTSTLTDSIIYDNGTRVSIGADVTTSNKFTAVASTTSSYAVVAQASGAANGFWATLSGTGEIFRGQTSGGSYFIINNGGNAFLNGNLNVGDFASTSYKLNVVGTANFTGALSGTSATFSGAINLTGTANSFQVASIFRNANRVFFGGDTGGYFFQNSANSATLLQIADSGAATFSSSVTASSTITAPYINIQAGANAEVANINSTNANGGYLTWQTSGSVIADIGTLQQIFGSGGSTNFGINARGAKDLAFGTNNTERLRVTSSGNVGIGTTAPSFSNTGTGLNVQSASGDGAYLKVSYSGGNSAEFRTGFSVAGIGNVSDNPFQFFTNNTERMRITSGGDVLISGTSTSPVTSNVQGIYLGAQAQMQASVDGRPLLLNRRLDNGNIIEFYRSGTSVGSISVTTSATSFNTSSDYRLKEDLKPIKGLEIVNKIKVYDYKWKSEDSRMDGVLAHELAEVLPYAVSGVKDGEQMQSVDYSKIVPVMVQAIKEEDAKIIALQNKVTELETEIQTLKNK